MFKENGLEPSLNRGGQKPESRLVKGARLINESLFHIETLGEENLKEIPDGQKVIFAPSHITDMDVGCAVAAVGRLRGEIVAAGEASADTKIVRFIEKLLWGKDSIQDIGFSGKGDSRVGNLIDWLNSPEIKFLQDSLVNNQADVVMAAYSDLAHHKKTKFELSARQGIGAVYLSQLTGAMIVPTAVDVYADQDVNFTGEALTGYLRRRLSNPFKKPLTRVHIGSPLQFSPITDINLLAEMIEKGDRTAVHQILSALKDQSSLVMGSLAQMLPPEKRGIWGQ